MIKMYYMSFFGILLLLGSAVFLCKSAYSYYDRTLEYYREVLSFLYTVKQKISTSSTKITVILHDMDNLMLLCECGFIKKAGEQGVYTAYLSCEDKFMLDSEDKNILRGYFADMGKNMLCAEIENISRCITQLEAKYQTIMQQTPSKKKVSSTVIICIALLAVILIV